METIKKDDFVEIKYTGYSDGKVFDSNIEEDLKKLDTKAEAQKTIVIVGQGMVIPGFDQALEGKEIGKEYEINISAKEGFGPRIRELVKIIPLKVFTEKNIYPKPGMVLALDNSLAKVIAISGARVTTDFNNPLAGRDLKYKFTVVRKVEEEKEKVEVVFNFTLRFVPEFEVKDSIIVKGPKQLEVFATAFKERFKELIGKELKFELKEVKKEENKEENPEDKKLQESKPEQIKKESEQQSL